MTNVQSVSYKLIELFLLFVALPVSLVLPYALYFKLILIVLGFGYIITLLLTKHKQQFKINNSIRRKKFWKQIALIFTAIITLTTIYVYVTDASKLFVVLRNKPFFWLLMVFIYSFFSVYPQELIYRTFFFARYETLVKDKNLFIFLNAILFSLAHLLFQNSLVIILTFVGGLIFAKTFQKTRSTLFVTIEHAIYGSWLFTVGMGEMLGFPM